MLTLLFFFYKFELKKYQKRHLSLIRFQTTLYGGNWIVSLKNYLKVVWNLIKLAAMGFFFASNIIEVYLNYTESEDSDGFALSRIFLAIAIICFHMQIFQFYLIGKYLGPKVLIVSRMVIFLFNFFNKTHFIIQNGNR